MFIGIAIGSSTTAETFITFNTIIIFLFGLLSLILSTVIGILTAKIMNILTRGKVNQIIRRNSGIFPGGSGIIVR